MGVKVVIFSVMKLEGFYSMAIYLRDYPKITERYKLAEETLDRILVPRPKPDVGHPQNLCLDGGYKGFGAKAEMRGYREESTLVEMKRKNWSITMAFMPATVLLKFATFF